MTLGAGALATLIILCVGTWRTLRRPDSATLADRTVAVGPIQDERDRAILTKAAATLGYLTLPITSDAVVAIGVGAPTIPTLTILMFSEIVIALIAFIYQARTN